MINPIYNNLSFLNSFTRSIQNSSTIIKNIAQNALSEISFAKELKLSALTITTGLIITTCVLFIFIKTLANRLISEEARGKAVWRAVEQGNHETLTALLANGPISEEAREKAVWGAVDQGNQEILTALLANGPISEEARGWAVKRNSTIHQNQEILTSLLANGSISEEARGKAVFYAAEEGKQEILTTLLANGSISEETQGRAVLVATLYQNQAIFNALLANESTVPINFLAQIIVNCARWEQTAENKRQTEYLLANS